MAGNRVGIEHDVDDLQETAARGQVVTSMENTLASRWSGGRGQERPAGEVEQPQLGGSADGEPGCGRDAACPSCPAARSSTLKYPAVIDSSPFKQATGFAPQHDEDATMQAFARA